MHIIYLGVIYAFFIEIFYVLEGEKNMPSNKQLNTTVFMEDHHVVKDVGYPITTKKQTHRDLTCGYQLEK